MLRTLFSTLSLTFTILLDEIRNTLCRTNRFLYHKLLREHTNNHRMILLLPCQTHFVLYLSSTNDAHMMVSPISFLICLIGCYNKNTYKVNVRGCFYCRFLGSFGRSLVCETYEVHCSRIKCGLFGGCEYYYEWEGKQCEW